MTRPKSHNKTATAILLDWYDAHARALAWRAPPNSKTKPDPYRVWLAEIMLQQTTVATVTPYFEKFLRQFPTLQSLANAPDEAVMAAWAGLGYYSRARNLLKCARLVMAAHGGKLPNQEAALLQLPGIGAYTAAAIAAIAFNQPTAPVDGNIERVLARLFALATKPPALKMRVKEKLTNLVPANRAGDFIQALMDLGATICTPKQPKCQLCVWQNICAAHATQKTNILPHRAAKKPRPDRAGTIYWLTNAKGAVLMQRRPDKGLLGGMLTFPSSGWDAANDTVLPALVPQGWTALADEVVHVFTHFRLTLKIVTQTAPKNFRKPTNCQWIEPRDFATQALPSVMQKVAKLVLANR